MTEHVVTGGALGASLAGAALGANGETVVAIAVGASLAGVTVLGTTFIVKKGGRGRDRTVQSEPR
jgi:hypothetical protein